MYTQNTAPDVDTYDRISLRFLKNICNSTMWNGRIDDLHPLSPTVPQNPDDLLPTTGA